MLNLKRLQYLDAVYQYKNFTQASEALYVSQPAISSAVQALEEELGVTLLSRSRGGVTLTADGWALMPYIQEICRQQRRGASSAPVKRRKMPCGIWPARRNSACGWESPTC